MIKAVKKNKAVRAPMVHQFEYISMAELCCAEIRGLRSQIKILQAKAEAYDCLVTAMRLVPKKASGNVGIDLLWDIEKRVNELTANEVKAS